MANYQSAGGKPLVEDLITSTFIRVLQVQMKLQVKFSSENIDEAKWERFNRRVLLSDLLLLVR